MGKKVICDFMLNFENDKPLCGELGCAHYKSHERGSSCMRHWCTLHCTNSSSGIKIDIACVSLPDNYKESGLKEARKK